MKKLGHLNRDIARVLAAMGHTDGIVIADCGLPVPDGVECIDVSLRRGTPGFIEVLETVLADFQVERTLFASESLTHNAALAERAGRLEQSGVTVEYVAHEAFKRRCTTAKAIIRTGECTPYANVILYSGVLF